MRLGKPELVPEPGTGLSTNTKTITLIILIFLLFGVLLLLQPNIKFNPLSWIQRAGEGNDDGNRAAGEGTERSSTGEGGDGTVDEPPEEPDMESAPDRSARPNARAVMDIASEESELEGELSVHYEWLSSTGNGWISGVFRNDSEETIAAPEVTVTVWIPNEPTRRILMQASCDQLEPEETCPLIVDLGPLPATTTYEFKVELQPATGEPNEAEELSLEMLEPIQVEDRLVFGGSVRNEGEERAGNIRFRVTGYDEFDQIVGVSSQDLDHPGLGPEESTVFQSAPVPFANQPVYFSYEIVGKNIPHPQDNEVSADEESGASAEEPADGVPSSSGVLNAEEEPPPSPVVE